MIGAMAAAANRPPAFRTLVATAPSARKIGLSIMIRVSSTVSRVWAASKPGVMSATMAGRGDQHDQPEDEQRPDDEVGDRRDHPPGPRWLAGREQARHDRDQGRGQRAGRDELEDQVRDPERGEERVEVGERAAVPDDDDGPDPAEDARHEERGGDDQPRPRQVAGRGHGVGSRRARGCASRYAARSRVGETCV